MSQQRLSYQYTIHCLANGSEYTDATLLLSVERGTTFVQRYALTGLTCMAARLAADQRVPLHTIRACFGGTVGLSSLLLSLSQAGVAEVSVCGSVENVETISSVILGKRSYPLVRTCEVPDDGTWYQVYKDDYLQAHGKRVAKHLVWIYTLLKHSASHVVSFAVIPSQMDEAALKPLPEDVNSTLDCIFYLEKAYNTSSTSTTTGSSGQLATRFYYTDPMQSNDWLLNRASRYARRLANDIPFAFSFRTLASVQRGDYELTTGSRLCLHDWIVTEADLRSKPGDDDSDTVDNTDAKPDEADPEERDKKPFTADETGLMEELQAIWSGSHAADENEINIDGDDDHINYAIPLVPHLLILGTGCASPSALRGSSGYALFTPQDNDNNKALSLTAILDCGEGTLTNLHRHLPVGLAPLDEQLTQIRFIWISHAHLDHYGGLGDLILAIDSARRRRRCEPPTTKRQKTAVGHDETPVVIAPATVLNFLDACLSLHYHHTDDDQQQQPYRRLYRGATHRDYEVSPFADDLRRTVSMSGTVLRSIQVEHCAHAHGIQIELSNGIRFCYSGDTRPSNHLIRAASQVGSGAGVSLLLHEGTFEDDPRGKKEAQKKKHSTVLEAMDVAWRMKAKVCLLTHFSQRYPKAPPRLELDPKRSGTGDTAVEAAFAVDGMWIPLTDPAIAKLPILSNLVQQLLHR